MDRFRKADKEYKVKQKSQFDRRHGVRPLSALPAGTKVWGNVRLPEESYHLQGHPGHTLCRLHLDRFVGTAIILTSERKTRTVI